MECITSRKNPIFKRLVKLEESTKKRRVCGLTILDGAHLINSYYAKLGVPKCLISNESGCKNKEIKQLLILEESEAVDVFVLSDALFHEISPVKTPTGIIALVDIPNPRDIPVRKSERFCVLLESIQDPGNLGSILRSAAVAGVCDAYLSEGCADAWSPKTLRAAMGAHFMLRIYEQSNLVKVIQKFKGKVIATTLKTNKSLYKTHLSGPIAFAFGNEGIGLSDVVRQAASEQVAIPMVNKTESLNVAAAAAICLFEKVRQNQ
ncbi:MAG: RNA methyltransferase [Betaproteobacteria bacterium]|nr:MAG: RNA methyltransferase [Betaproteobacteria bacterium]